MSLRWLGIDAMVVKFYAANFWHYSILHKLLIYKDHKTSGTKCRWPPDARGDYLFKVIVDLHKWHSAHETCRQSVNEEKRTNIYLLPKLVFILWCRKPKTPNAFRPNKAGTQNGPSFTHSIARQHVARNTRHVILTCLTSVCADSPTLTILGR